MQKTPTRPWDPTEHLETEHDMAAYLNVALEEFEHMLASAALTVAAVASTSESCEA